MRVWRAWPANTRPEAPAALALLPGTASRQLPPPLQHDNGHPDSPIHLEYSERSERVGTLSSLLILTIARSPVHPLFSSNKISLWVT